MNTSPWLRCRRRFVASYVGVALASVALASLPVRAQGDVESFYKGRTIDILIGFPPGGSYDTYARLTAQFMGKYIPGDPSFVIQNRPSNGPGVVRALIESAPRDGSLISILPQTIAVAQLTQPEMGNWDVRDMQYIGSFANVNLAFMLRNGAPAKSAEDLRKIPVNVGCNNHVGVTYIFPVILKKLGGFPFNIICGYPGTSSFPPAIARGEIDLVSGDWVTWRGIAESTLPGKVRPVIQAGLKRHKDMPDVPLMQEMVSDPDAKKVIEFFSSASAIGRALIAPPGLPPARLAELRGAFDRMVKDPDFLAQVSKLHEEIDPTSGEETQRISDATFETPEAIVKKAIEASE